MKILIVDDDPRLRDLVRLTLERADFTVITAANGALALTHAAREAPDLIILDVGMPDMDGLDCCRRIRAVSQVPVLFLTARDDEIDRILGFEMGADDYVTKPFSPRELVARVKVILKRSGRPVEPAVLQHGQITLDIAARQCRLGAADVALTMIEFDLLSRLMQAQGRLTPRPALIAALWGAQSAVSDRTLDSHLRNLRRKLTQAGCTGAIDSVHGQGVRLGPCL
jgi:two-component system, OmpR family, response regulator